MVKETVKANIIRSKELVENNCGDTKVTDVLVDREWNLSIAKVRKVVDDIKQGFDPGMTAYYVLEGEGKCVIDGEEHHLKKGDCVVYPPGVAYKHLKGLTLLAISAPCFDREKRTYIE